MGLFERIFRDFSVTIFTNFSGNVCVLHILLLSTFEVNCIIFHEVMTIHIFYSFYIGNPIFAQFFFNLWTSTALQQIIAERWLTPRWKAIIKLLSKINIWLTHLWSFCWCQHFISTSRPKIPKMTSRDVTWRHVIRFLPKFANVFLYFISYLCQYLKSFAYV